MKKKTSKKKNESVTLWKANSFAHKDRCFENAKLIILREKVTMIYLQPFALIEFSLRDILVYISELHRAEE